MNKLSENRRDFIKKSLKIAGLSACGCVAASIIAACDKDGETVPVPTQPLPENYPVIQISNFAPLTAVGGIIMTLVRDKDNKVVNQGNPLIIYRLEQNRFIVLDTLCRHASAMVQLPSTPGGDIFCPVHSAKFDSTNGSLKDPGSASGTVPPLLKYNSMYDAEKNELTIAI